ncbi:MAG: prolyl oligopeptidase family serine peptidase, partial [Pirellulales bacterium]|nr:prolyl oligopeptidase family serine peptidase [Pirellulales bacterium]
MMTRLWCHLCLGLLLVMGVPFLKAEEPDGETASVRQTYDRHPFTYRMKPASQRPGYKIYQIEYPSPVTTSVEQNNTIPAEYFLPDTAAEGTGSKRPAVICLHILDGNEVLTDLVCSTLARRGIPAIMFKLPYYGKRALPQGPMAMAKDPRLFASAIAQAEQDVRRTVDLLASRPEVDPQKIGITGISLGGLVSATAAGTEPRLARVGLILAGGDLRKIIGYSRETRPLRRMIDALPPQERRFLEEKIAAVDPLRNAPALRQRAAEGRVLMINAAEDEVIPRACTEKLAAALGLEKKVVWLEGLGHYTALAELPRVLNMTADFFAQDLPPGDAPPPVYPPEKTSAVRVADVLQQLDTLLTGKPERDRCHRVELEFQVI